MPLLSFDIRRRKPSVMCGIFGIFGHEEAANLTYLGLHALQHRGQESAGIVSSDGQKLHAHREMGLVGEAFSAEKLAKLSGRVPGGENRGCAAPSSRRLRAALSQ